MCKVPVTPMGPEQFSDIQEKLNAIINPCHQDISDLASTLLKQHGNTPTYRKVIDLMIEVDKAHHDLTNYLQLTVEMWDQAAN